MEVLYYLLVVIILISKIRYVYVSFYNIINGDKIERAHYLVFLAEKLADISPERFLTEEEAAAMSEFYGEPIEASEPIYRISGSFSPFLIRDKKWGKPARLRRFFERFEIDIDIVKELEFCIDENNTIEFILPARQRGALAVSIDDSFDIINHRDLDKIGQTEYHFEETKTPITYNEYNRAHIDKRRIPSLIVASLLVSYFFINNSIIAAVVLLLAFAIFIRWVFPKPFHKTDLSKKFRVKLTGRLRGQGLSYRLGPYYLNFRNFTTRLRDLIGEDKEITIEGLQEERKGSDGKVISVLSLNGKYFDDPAYNKEEEYKETIIERIVDRNKRYTYLFLFMFFPVCFTLYNTDLIDKHNDFVNQLSTYKLQHEFNSLEEFRNYPIIENQEVTLNNLRLLPNIDKSPSYYTIVPKSWKHDIDLSKINERIALIEQIQYTKELIMTITSIKTRRIRKSPYGYFKTDPNYSKLQRKSLFIHHVNSFPDSYYFKLLLEICYLEAKYEWGFDQSYVLDENSQMLKEYLTKKYKLTTPLKAFSNYTLLNEKKDIFKGFIDEQKSVIIDVLLEQGAEQIAKSDGIAVGPNYRRLNPYKPELLSNDFYIIQPTDKYLQSDTKNFYSLAENLPAVSSVKNISETLLESDDYSISGVVIKLTHDDEKLTKVFIDQDKHYGSLFNNFLDIIHAWITYILFFYSLFIGRVYRYGQF